MNLCYSSALEAGDVIRLNIHETHRITHVAPAIIHPRLNAHTGRPDSVATVDVIRVDTATGREEFTTHIVTNEMRGFEVIDSARMFDVAARKCKHFGIVAAVMAANRQLTTQKAS